MRCGSNYLRAAFAATALLPLAVQAAPPARTAKAPHSAIDRSTGSNPLPTFEKRPDWVETLPVPAPDPARKSDPFQFLLLGSQEYLSKDGVQDFGQYVVVVQNQAGVQAFGTVALPWNSEKTSMALHAVKVIRGDQTIDALRPEDVSVIRRETKLEQSTLNGLRTVVLPVRDLRVGDQLEVAFSYQTRPQVIGRPEEVQDFAIKVPVQRLIRRFIIADDLPVRWSVDPSLAPSRDKTLPGATERIFEAKQLETPKDIPFEPARFAHKFVQVSSFTDWGQVVEPMVPMYQAARHVAAGSRLALLADKIAADHKAPADRILAVLRVAQDDVRYVALLLGDGGYQPMTAESVWEQRFGDCKGKSAFILALLDRMHIEAEPMLASLELDDTLGQRLPTLAMFDHVIVRAHAGGETYYLDGTNFGQRTLEELKQSPAKYGLPIVAGAELVTTPDIMPSAPLYETALQWDASKDIVHSVPMTATLTIRGSAAAEMRQKAINSTDQDKLIEGIKNHVMGASNDVLEYQSTDPEMSDGSYVVHFKGTAELDWTPVDGLKGNRLQLSQSPLSWDPGFKRDQDAAKAIPVKMSFPYWERLTETVILPGDGKGFVLEAKPVDQVIAVTRLSRTVSQNGPVITLVSDFKRLAPELAADAARSAEAPLDAMSRDYAYVVSKKKLKLTE